MQAIQVTNNQTTKNKEIVRRFVEEMWNEGKLDVADEVLAANYIEHPSTPDDSKKEEPTGPDGMKRFVQMFRNAFPDMVFNIEHMVAEDDRVAIHLVGRGTHQGELHGLPPTGKSVTIGGAAIHRLQNNKIVETYQVVDRLSLREQLGVPQMGDIDVE
ncbi:MAG TPA: ester cyclase [Pyrinomonadaceae bacterium]|nr:ester cyclase [Pyrinomonadaceae bacterium]